MTPVEALQAIAARLEAEWSATPVTYDAMRFDPPADAAFVRVTIRDLPTRKVTHGNAGARQATRAALLIAQVFAPIGEVDSSHPALKLAEQFRALFEGRDVPDTPGAECINFEDATVRRIGVDGGLYQVNVNLPHTYPQTF